MAGAILSQLRAGSGLKAAICVICATVLVAAVAHVLLFSPKLCSVERESYKLGTVVRVTIWGEDKAQLEKAIDAAMSFGVDNTEHLFSATLPNSEVSRINAAARGGASVEINPVADSAALLIAKAHDIAGKTDGAFDPTIAPVVKLWGIGTDHARVPLADEINEALRSVDYRRLSVAAADVQKDGPPRYKVTIGAINAPRTSIDMGGIAKGYAADMVAIALRGHGVKRAMIDLGGNIYVIGKSPKDKPWRIGVQHPFRPRGEYIGVVECEDASVVTSGPYERYFDSNGVRYHHIFDPKTGRPAKSDLASVTVVSKISADADAYCTAFFVMGFDRTSAFLKNHRYIQAILVRNDKKVFVTEGLKGKFSIKDTGMKLEVLNGTGTEPETAVHRATRDFDRTTRSGDMELQ